MKATLFERLGAYLIDITIITLISSIICSSLPNNSIEVQKQMLELNEQLTTSEITEETYLDEYTTLIYNYQKDSIIPLSVTLILNIAYFVVFQYTNKGQTLGKKLLNIKVIDKNKNNPPNILQGLLRSLFIFNIASGVLNIIFIYILNKNNYFLGYGLISGFEMIFTIITIILIIYQKEKQGLHDLMTNTLVIKEKR